MEAIDTHNQRMLTYATRLKFIIQKQTDCGVRAARHDKGLATELGDIASQFLELWEDLNASSFEMTVQVQKRILDLEKGRKE